MIIMKCKYLIFLVIVIGLLALVVINYSLSYSRRIGNTHFYLVETMALSEKGESLAGLYYRSDSTTGYIGEMTPGFPLIILWNDKYLISKNYDGNHPIIIKYVVINLDSINTDYWRTRQTLWSAVQMLTQKLCCQTIHDCPKVVPLHYESE